MEEKRRESIEPPCGRPWPGGVVVGTLRSASLSAQGGSWQLSLSQCCCLRCHFLFWVTGEGESRWLPATPPESGTALVWNGPVSIFDFRWGLAGRSVARQALRRRTQGSRGSSPCPPGPSNVLGERETLIRTQCEVHSVSRKGWSWQDPGGPPPSAAWQAASGTSASGGLQIED